MALAYATKELQADREFAIAASTSIARKPSKHKVRFTPTCAYTAGQPVVVSFPGTYGSCWDLLQGAESDAVRSLQRCLISSGTVSDAIRWAKGLRTTCVFLPDDKCPEYGKDVEQAGTDS